MTGSVDAMLDEKYGKVGTPERESFRKEARAYCKCENEADTTNKQREAAPTTEPAFSRKQR